MRRVGLLSPRTASNRWTVLARCRTDSEKVWDFEDPWDTREHTGTAVPSPDLQPVKYERAQGGICFGRCSRRGDAGDLQGGTSPMREVSVVIASSDP